jgi:hypothetical protein
VSEEAAVVGNAAHPMIPPKDMSADGQWRMLSSGRRDWAGLQTTALTTLLKFYEHHSHGAQ